MQPKNFLRILGLTVLVVAATVGLAFLLASKPIDAGRFSLALVPVVFAELLLGGGILFSGTDSPRSARLLFGFSRAWVSALYLGFTLLAAAVVALGAGIVVLAVAHIIAAVAVIGWFVLGSMLAESADASEAVHPVDSTLSQFKSAVARLHARLRVVAAPGLESAKSALAKAEDDLRYVYVESTAASAADDAEIGELLGSLQAAVEQAEQADAAAAQTIVGQAARLSAAVKRRTATLARRL
jgi:hypothetical protein